MWVQRQGGWQGGKSQPQGALQIIRASLSSEPIGVGLGEAGTSTDLLLHLLLITETKSVMGMKMDTEERS